MKLRSYLILLVVGAVLPVVIFAGVMVYVSYQQQSENLAQGMIDRARAISAALDREFLISIQSLKVLAASTHLDKGQLQEFYGDMKGALAAHSRAWQNLTLVDASGQQLINLRRPFGSPLPRTGNPEAIEHVRQSKEAAIANLSPGPVTGAPGIVVHVPVLKDGRVKYFLNVVFYPAPLTDLLLQQQLSSDWIATIIDRNHIMVARTRDVGKFLGKPASSTFAAQAGQSREATWRETTIEGTAVVAALHRSDFTGWTVGVAIPMSLLEAPMKSSLIILTAGGLLLLLTGIGLAFLFGSRISRPIAALSAAATALGKGETPRCDASPIVEVNHTARAIEDASVRRKQAEEALTGRNMELQALQEVSQAILMSPDVQTTMEKILENAVALGSYDLGIIRLVDPNTATIKPVAYRGYVNPENIHSHPQLAAADATGRLTARVVTFREPRIEEDVPNCEGLRTWKKEGVQSAIVIPVRAGEEVLGVLQLGARSPRKFTPDAVRLLMAVGDQLGIAIQKSRANEETKRHLERIRALHEIDLAITSTLELQTILNVLLEKIEVFLPIAASSTVRLLRPDSGELESLACRGLDEKAWRSQARTTLGGRAEKVVQTRAPVVVADIQRDTRTYNPAVFRGLVSYLGVPLIVHDTVLGVLSLYTRKEHEFTREESEFLVTLAGQAAIAIHNAQLYEEMVRANKVKDEFLSVMSHELRTPLSVIMGYTGMLRDGMLGEINPKQEEALQKVLGRAGDQLNMVNEIMQTTQLESRSVTAGREPVILSGLMEQLRADYQLRSGKPAVKLVWDYPAGPIEITTDSAKLKQILQNLVNNALKFTDDGTVTISARVREGVSDHNTQHLTPDSRFVELKVSDTGIGIPPEKLQQIFDKFYQVDSSETRLYGGVGLGLYIVKHFTDLLGGTVSVESEPGKGSTFVVRLLL
jgi:signal transduction histidine kinase